MLAAKLGPLSSKNYSLTTRGEKERRIGGKWPRLSVTNCRVHRCIQVLTFLFQTKCLKFLYFVPESFKSLLFMLIFSYFSHELFWKMAETYVYMYVWELNHWGSPLSGDRDNSTFGRESILCNFYITIECVVPFVSTSSSFFELHSLYGEHREQSMSQEITYKSLKMIFFYWQQINSNNTQHKVKE